MQISSTKTITDISLFDFMKVFFTDTKTYNQLTNKAKQKHCFMFFRFMSIMYPVQMHTFGYIHDIRIIDALHKAFCKPNSKFAPKWLYTKSDTKKTNTEIKSSELDIPIDILNKFSEIYNLEPKSMDFICKEFPEVVKEECKKLKEDLENSTSKSKSKPKKRK